MRDAGSIISVVAQDSMSWYTAGGRYVCTVFVHLNAVYLLLVRVTDFTSTVLCFTYHLVNAYQTSNVWYNFLCIGENIMGFLCYLKILVHSFVRWGYDCRENVTKADTSTSSQKYWQFLVKNDKDKYPKHKKFPCNVIISIKI